MATVLVSFIGTGDFKGKDYEGVSNDGYKLVKYVFEDTSEITTTIFGSALLQNLKANQRPVNSWLIMGTAQSIWSELVNVFYDKRDDVIDSDFSLWEFLYEQAKNDARYKTKDSKISQIELNKWGTILSENLPDTKVFCRRVDDGTDEKSQMLIFQALLDVIESGDNVVFDVTHGLRNQPIIVSFALMYLRYLRNVEKVEFYYGAKDLDGKVVKLDFCNQLLEATEAISTFQQTGNFIKLGGSIGLPISDVKKIAFLDETNKPDEKLAESIKNELSKDGNFDVIQQELLPYLDKALRWAKDTNLEFRYWRKSRFAFEHEQFLKAIVLLWEAILVAGCKRYKLADLTDFRNRDTAEKELRKELEKTDKQRVDVLEKIEFLRNAVAHGTKTVRDDVKNATENKKDFKKIYNEGEDLLKFLIGNLS